MAKVVKTAQKILALIKSLLKTLETLDCNKSIENYDENHMNQSIKF